VNTVSAARDRCHYRRGKKNQRQRASAALKYLARYVVGAAISDRRILTDDGRDVAIIEYLDHWFPVRIPASTRCLGPLNQVADPDARGYIEFLG
jgi:hypothetical protein